MCGFSDLWVLPWAPLVIEGPFLFGKRWGEWCWGKVELGGEAHDDELFEFEGCEVFGQEEGFAQWFGRGLFFDADAIWNKGEG